MKTTLKKPTTIRLDEQTKKWAQSFARSSGIDLSTLITLSLRETQRNGSVKIEPEMSPERVKYYQDMIRDVDSGKVKTTKHASFDDFKKHMLKI